MVQIAIRIKDRKKAQTLINFLKTLDFIESVSEKDLSVENATSENGEKIFSHWLACGLDVTSHFKLFASKPGHTAHDSLRYKHPDRVLQG